MGNIFSRKEKREKKKKGGIKEDKSTTGEQNGVESPVGPVSTSGGGDSGGSHHSSKVRVKALYNFEGMNEDDIPFQQGDLLEVDKSVFDQTSELWWYATHLKSKQVGYIPGNYVIKDDSTPQSQEWWKDVQRPEADKVLLLPGNKNGTFLVRMSKDNNYALSVLAIEPTTGEPGVRHYRVKKMDDGEGVYIAPTKTFQDLFSLIEYYKSADATGLCCRLTEPFPHIRPPVLWRELEVKRETIQLTSKLGAGHFGEVWKGKYRRVIDVAVKTLKPGTMTSEAFLQEAKIMNKLAHPRLVQLIAVVSTTEPFFIITELMLNGCLLEYLHSDQGKLLKLPQFIHMNEQVSEGMAYLEKQNNIHRDLRAANILVGEHHDVKIADFGLARILDDDIYGAAENTKFPIKWTAPEAATQHIFSIKSDVWSFGILMYEIITLGRTPYPGMSGHEVIRWIENGHRMEKPRGPPEVPDEYYDMMKKCWHAKPEDRPTFEYIYTFFSDYLVNVEEQYKEAA